MISRSSWAATAVGTAVGTGGWLLGLGDLFWPSHPMWALFFVTIAVTILTRVVVEREVRRVAGRTQN
jgi:hypothetical protein